MRRPVARRSFGGGAAVLRILGQIVDRDVHRYGTVGVAGVASSTSSSPAMMKPTIDPTGTSRVTRQRAVIARPSGSTMMSPSSTWASGVSGKSSMPADRRCRPRSRKQLAACRRPADADATSRYGGAPYTSSRRCPCRGLSSDATTVPARSSSCRRRRGAVRGQSLGQRGCWRHRRSTHRVVRPTVALRLP